MPAVQAVPLSALFHSLVVEFEPLAHAKDRPRLPRERHRRPLRSPAAAPDDPEPARQRPALHRAGCGQTGRAPPRRGRAHRGLGHGARHPAGRAHAHLRGVPARVRLRARRPRRHGTRASIVERMGAALGHRIELCSKVGHGTRFSILAPARPPPRRRSRSASAAGPRARPTGSRLPSVLVIDNDERGLEAMRSRARWKCEARGLRDLAGLDALMQDQPEFRPDLVIADYHLDRRECGLSAVTRLRGRWGAGLPALVITADHSPPSRRSRGARLRGAVQAGEARRVARADGSSAARVRRRRAITVAHSFPPPRTRLSKSIFCTSITARVREATLSLRRISETCAFTVVSPTSSS